jgi:ABC-2 type transport system ATP-binding protein
MSFTLRNIVIENCRAEAGRLRLFVSPQSACFRNGQLNVISGPNGIGKTLLLEFLALRGNGHFRCSLDRSGHQTAREIAYLPQVTANVLDIKIGHLIDLAFRNRSELPKVPPAIEPILGSPHRELGELSGGQQQLLLFWLVASQPLHVFIYDEPLRHLDSDAANFVARTIEEQVTEGELVILSDHSNYSSWNAIVFRLQLDRSSTLSGEILHD